MRPSIKRSSVRAKPGLTLVPKPSRYRLLDAANDAIARADYTVAHLLLSELNPTAPPDRARCELARARLARCEGDTPTWRSAAAYAAAHLRDPAARLYAKALHAAALKRGGDTNAAARLFEDVRSTMQTLPPQLTGETGYLLALDDWQEQRYDRAEQIVSDCVFAGANVAECRSLWGWIDVKRERYRAASGHFTEALSHLRVTGETDARFAGIAIQSLSIIAAETMDVRSGERALREHERFTWPASLAVQRFWTLVELSYVSLLHGDMERAWTLMRDAAAFAPSMPFAVLGEANAASMALRIGDSQVANVQMSRAAELMEKARWSEAAAEERGALLSFAIECAHALPVEARQAIIRYQSLTGRTDPMSSLNADRRIAGLELNAAARLSESLGDPDQALRYYRRALGLWNELDYRLKAAFTALDIRRLAEDRRADAAIALGRTRAPKASFLQNAPRASDPRELLSPAQRAVFDLLASGASTDEIAAKLGRSRATIAGHLRAIEGIAGPAPDTEPSACAAEPSGVSLAGSASADRTGQRKVDTERGHRARKKQGEHSE